MDHQSAYLLKILDAQPREDTLAVAAAVEIRRLLNIMRSRDQDMAAINRDVARLRAGIPDGVTAEEWEILRELRRVAPHYEAAGVECETR